MSFHCVFYSALPFFQVKSTKKYILKRLGFLRNWMCNSMKIEYPSYKSLWLNILGSKRQTISHYYRETNQSRMLIKNCSQIKGRISQCIQRIATIVASHQHHQHFPVLNTSCFHSSEKYFYVSSFTARSFECSHGFCNVHTHIYSHWYILLLLWSKETFFSIV